MIITQGRLTELGNELRKNIRDKRANLDIDSNCFNILTDWKEFMTKYQVVPASTPLPSPKSKPRPTKPAERVAKYIRMVKGGLPRGSVMKKMLADGVPPSLLPSNIQVDSPDDPAVVSKSGRKSEVRKPNGWWVARSLNSGMAH